MLEIVSDPAAIRSFCKQHGIAKLAFFGSVLRDDFGPESDVDVLVEFEPGAQVTLFTMTRLEDELSDLLGRRVDLREPQELSPYFRSEVVAGAAVQYAA